MRWIQRVLTDERGSALVSVTVGLVALFGTAALAIDLGMLFTARGEAQRAADAASLAGAASLIEAPTSTERARQIAMEYAARNTIRNAPVSLEPEDVEVDLEEAQVRVTVRRVAERSNAVPTWFARVLGIDAVDITATAVAARVSGSSATCVRPFAVPDAWDDANGNEKFDPGEFYDPQVTGYGTDFRDGIASNNGIDPPDTIYQNDFGRPTVLKPGRPQKAIVPSWYFPWALPGGVGGDWYRDNIATCNPALITIGGEYMVEVGNMVGPTRQGVEDLVSLDPDAGWDASADSVAGSAFQSWTTSPRVVTLALVDPSMAVDPGRRPIIVRNMTAFFLVGLGSRGGGGQGQGAGGGDVVGRFLFASGLGGATSPTGPQIKFVRLVE